MGWVSPFLELAVWPAAFMGLLAALAGDRAGRALLAGHVVAFIMERSGMDFQVLIWALVDTLIVLTIVRRNMPFRDLVITLLYVPMWIFYKAPDPFPHWVSCIGVIAQFLVASTAPDVRKCWRNMKIAPISNPFDLKLRADRDVDRRKC